MTNKEDYSVEQAERRFNDSNKSLGTKRKSEVDQILEERAETHGDFRVNFRKIADKWTAHLNHKITPLDVALMMIELKISRIQNGKRYNPDDFDDIQGYSKIARQLQGDEHVNRR